MPEPLFVASGKNGQVELYESRIVITRKGVLGKLTHWGKGEKEIRTDDITGIQFKEPGLATAGYIQFGQSGYSEDDGGTFSAADDENSVTFKKKQLEDFETLRQKINDFRDSAGSASSDDEDSAIEALRKQYAEGEISKEEYEKRMSVLEE